MASRVANGEEDWFILFLGCCKSLLAPGIPVDRVARVLEQVRAFLEDEAVIFGTAVGREFGYDLWGRDRFALVMTALPFCSLHATHSEEKQGYSNREISNNLDHGSDKALAIESPIVKQRK